MIGEDRDVLEFLGQKGKSPEEIGERFPGFDMLRLVRAGLVEEQHIKLAETSRRRALRRLRSPGPVAPLRGL